MMIGIPASGKTTKALHMLKFKKEQGTTIVRVSNDAVGKLMTGQAFCKGTSGFMLASVELFVRYLLSQDISVIIDNTAVTKQSRSKWFALAKEMGVTVKGYYANTDINTCLKQNMQRDAVVPEDVIKSMHKKLQKPTMKEPFTKLFTRLTKTKAGTLKWMVND